MSASGWQAPFARSLAGQVEWPMDTLPVNPLAGMLETHGPGAIVQAREETLALLARTRNDAQVREWMQHLAAYLPRDAPSPLDEYLRLALLGVCAGFLERTLSPYAPQHEEIIPPLMEEITAVFDQVRAMGSAYDVDEFRYRAFHYGLHKACYLDWRLYLSNTCY
ncbi:MAG TPA: hypothetical protein VGQ71_05620 [Terriglobales bacterium]|nr:hypothetical protein [Terriglobales bacterium]